MTVLYDTGSGFTWIATDSCWRCLIYGIMTQHTSDSSSFQSSENELYVEYGTGQIMGNKSNEKIGYGENT